MHRNRFANTGEQAMRNIIDTRPDPHAVRTAKVTEAKQNIALGRYGDEAWDIAVTNLFNEIVNDLTPEPQPPQLQASTQIAIDEARAHVQDQRSQGWSRLDFNATFRAIPQPETSDAEEQDPERFDGLS
jgi:hypothetical protein